MQDVLNSLDFHTDTKDALEMVILQRKYVSISRNT